MQSINATELVKNMREILDTVSRTGETVFVERNSVMIAQIVPPERTMTARQALAGLAFPMLTPNEAKAWLKDSKAGFDDAVSDQCRRLG
jgi:antitoxin (DNA-binding transcriptional repressor) of toxin-antitoxin stability system